nr:hypothetical protein [uncultured Rhodoferax sp.]
MNYLIAAIIIALAGFGAGWKTQDWRYGAKEKERAENNLEIERIAGADRSRRDTQVIKAQSAGAQRAHVASVDADTARNAADRLRVELDRANANAQLSLDACTRHAAALRGVLDESVAEYRQMGATAEGHANDVRTLTEAWPRE